MNCSQARALFSARVDFELTGPESLEHDSHLSRCGSCEREWHSFQSTVSMVRLLPVEAPSPSFVGQVLDRVRAYEAQPVPSYLEPADLPVPEVQTTTVGWRTRFREIVGALRNPIPAFAVASMALGVVLGSLVTEMRSHADPQQAAPIAAMERTTPVSPTHHLVTVDGDHSINPFADLAGQIQNLPSGAAGSQLTDPVSVVAPTPDAWSAESGLQQQVRADNGTRPRITF